MRLLGELTTLFEDLDVPQGYEIRMGGEQEDQKESGAFLAVAFLAALVLILLVKVLLWLLASLFTIV